MNNVTSKTHKVTQHKWSKKRILAVSKIIDKSKHEKPWTFNRLVKIIGEDNAEIVALHCKNKKFSLSQSIDVNNSELAKKIGRPALHLLLQNKWYLKNGVTSCLTSRKGYSTEACRLYLIGLGYDEIAARFNVTTTRIHSIVSDERLLSLIASCHKLPIREVREVTEDEKAFDVLREQRSKRKDKTVADAQIAEHLKMRRAIRIAAQLSASKGKGSPVGKGRGGDRFFPATPNAGGEMRSVRSDRKQKGNGEKSAKNLKKMKK